MLGSFLCGFQFDIDRGAGVFAFVVPAIFGFREFSVVGGLMTYGSDIVDGMFPPSIGEFFALFWGWADYEPKDWSGAAYKRGYFLRFAASTSVVINSYQTKRP